MITKGMRCPKCGQNKTFRVYALAWFRVDLNDKSDQKSGTISQVPGDPDIELSDAVECGICETGGTVEDFGGAA